MDSPLNIAHRHQRKAEAYLKMGKYDEAVEQHIAAERALSEVGTTAISSAVMESIKEQREFHIRQQAVVRFKQKRAELVKTQQENIKKLTSSDIGTILSTPEHEQQKCNLVVQKAVKSLYIHDLYINSLIEASKKLTENEVVSCMSTSVDSNKTDLNSTKVFKEKLEQVRVSNEEIRKTVCQIMNEVQKLQTENKTLRNSLEELLLEHQECFSSKTSKTD